LESAVASLGAKDPERFWELLRDDVDAIGDVPADR
jgi:acyl transferase domain-containing protein